MVLLELILWLHEIMSYKMDQYYKDLIILSGNIENKINYKDYPILSKIFDHSYFEKIRQQKKLLTLHAMLATGLQMVTDKQNGRY